MSTDTATVTSTQTQAIVSYQRPPSVQKQHHLQHSDTAVTKAAQGLPHPWRCYELYCFKKT